METLKKKRLILLLIALMLIFSVTLFACGEPTEPSATKFTVSFNTNGGSAVASQEVDSGGKVTKPTDPTKASTSQYDYTFDGWFKESTFITEWNFTNDTVTANTTLYAKFTESERPPIATIFTVSFNTNGGSLVIFQEVGTGEKVTKPSDPTKASTAQYDYTFAGWFKDANFITEWNFITDSVTANTTLYAKFTESATPISKLIVSFNTNGGSEVAIQKLESGGKILKPSDPTKPSTEKYDYAFAGWFKESAFVTAWNFTNDSVTANTTLYAKFTESEIPLAKFIVSFNTNGGSLVIFQEVGSGEKVTKPTDPTKPSTEKYDYTFAGWFKDANFITEWNFNNDVVSGNTTLYAKFVESETPAATKLLKYTLNEDGQSYSVTGVENKNITDITIPQSYNQKPVTSIGREAFSGCRNLTSIIIPNSITSIDREAFSGCTNLTNITIPNSVTSIGQQAFYNCNILTSITLPFVGERLDGTGNTKFSFIFGSSDIPTSLKTVIVTGGTSIAESAFLGCVNLTSITLPFVGERLDGTGRTNFSYIFGGSIGIPSSLNTVVITGGTSIAESAFLGCKSLTSIILPDSLTSIGKEAFRDCSGLTSITIPNSVTSIGESAFRECRNLTSVTIGNSVTSIGNSTFRSCSGLTSVTIGTGVTSIGDYAFSNCGSLTEINIPNSVTSIGEYAFYGCSSLKSINIPDSVISIGGNAFYYCSGLTSVTIGSGVTSIGNSAFSNCGKLTSITIGSGVTSIGNSAFNSCYNLKSITIPNSVTSIARSAFSGCTGLTSITLPFVGEKINGTTNTNFSYIFSENSSIPSSLKTVIITGVTSIGDSAFRGYSGLTSVTIGNSVTSIGNSAFNDCKGLTEINIPNSVTSIGDSAFWGCTGLTSITIGSGVTSIGNNAFGYCYNLKSITIPDSVISIGGNAFYYCSRLTSVTIGNSVTSIGNNAFERCSGLTSVTIGNSVTSIGMEAFRDCGSLTEINIPNSVTSIGNSAFNGCSGLTSITIGSGVATIGSYAFSSCTNLTSITVDSGNSKYEVVDNCLIELSTNTLVLGCKNSLIPNSVIIIGGHAFRGCTSLTEINVPNSVKSIGSYAFSDCSSLTSIIIPISVTSIGSYAFSGCTKLTNIYCEADTKPNDWDSNWKGSNSATVTWGYKG